MTDPHEMRLVDGRVRAVYTDARGREYIVVEGEMSYIAREADWRKRPRKPAAAKRSKFLQMYVTEAEHARVTADAANAGLSVCEYMRGKVLPSGGND